MATDLAEVIGGAIALDLLFDLPLLLGGLIAGVVSLALLSVQNRRGQRPFERVITGFLLIIAVGFLAGLFVAPPSARGRRGGAGPAVRRAGLGAAGHRDAGRDRDAARGVPAFGLTRDRFGRVAPGPTRRRLLGATRTDVVLRDDPGGHRQHRDAAARRVSAAWPGRRRHDRGCARRGDRSLGPAVGVLFAVGLLASGLASTSVGCYAGSVIMEGLLRVRVNLLVRRVITLIPALIVLAVGADPTTVLVISQVVLSFGLPFVLVPLLRLTSDRTPDGPGPQLHLDQHRRLGHHHLHHHVEPDPDLRDVH